MHLALYSAPPVESSAARLLGTAHPLTRAFDRRSCLRLEIVVLGAVLVGAFAALAEGDRGAIVVVLAAGLASLPAVFRLLVVGTQIHGLLLELIVEGRGSLPLAEVQRECSRLLDVRRREREAGWLERVASGRDLGLGVPGRVPPLIDARVARAARDELLAVAKGLRGERPAVEGVALVQQIACEPWSPLFGQDSRAFREMLSRARFLLSA